MLLVFLLIMTFGTILMFFIRKIDGEDGKEKEPVGSSMGLVDSLVSLPRMIITPLLDVRMLLIVPLLAYSGLQQAFVWYDYHFLSL